MGGTVAECTGMRSRAPGRWGTKFGRWALAYGPNRLAVEISISTRTTLTPAAVYHWIAGRHIPRHEHALCIARLSSGHVSIDDIHRHRDAVAGPSSSGDGGKT